MRAVWQAKSGVETIDLLRLHEEDRIREMEAKAERYQVQRELEKRMQEEERRGKEEIDQSKLR